MANLTKIITPEPPAKDSMKQGVFPNLFVDRQGEEWELIGPCKGPKIIITDGKKKLTVWLRAGPGFNLSEKNYRYLLDHPEKVKRMRPEEKPAKITRKFLGQFRRGCRQIIYIPTSELQDDLDTNERVVFGVACRRCGTISEMHGSPKAGSVAEKNQKKAAAKKG